MIHEASEGRKDFEDTVPFSDDGAGADHTPDEREERVADRKASTSPPSLSDAIVTHRVRRMPKIRRTDLQRRRKRLLIQVLSISTSVIVLFIFMHFVALPMMDGDWLRSHGR